MRRVDGDREGVVARVDRALRHFIHEVVTARTAWNIFIVGAFGHGLRPGCETELSVWQTPNSAAA